eukprot:NODE_3_length_56144_cov_0.348184.p10 type:complete len:463 gc:universal NODE_3_length_56144_cov_0.348184:33308-34696(+)
MSSPPDAFYDAKSERSESLSPIILSPIEGGDMGDIKDIPVMDELPEAMESITQIKGGESIINRPPIKQEPNVPKSSSSSPTKSVRSTDSDKKQIKNTLESQTTLDSEGQTIQFMNEEQPGMPEIEEEENGMNDDLAKEFESLMQFHQESAAEDDDPDELVFTGEKLEIQEDVAIAPISFGLKFATNTVKIQEQPEIIDDDEFEEFEEFESGAPAAEVSPNEPNQKEPESIEEDIKLPPQSPADDEDAASVSEFSRIFEKGLDELCIYFTNDIPDVESDHVYDDSDRDIGNVCSIPTHYGPKSYFEPSEYLKELKEYQQLHGIFESNYVPKDQQAFLWQKSNMRRKLLQLSGIPLNLDEFYTNTQKRKFGALSAHELQSMHQMLDKINKISRSEFANKKLEELGTIHLSIEKALGRLVDANQYYIDQNDKIRANINVANKEIKEALLEAQTKKKTATKKKYFY